MNVLTIPKNLIKNDDLVVIPRKEYEAFLRVSSRQKPYSQLDRGLDEAIKEVREGKTTGPFSSVKELKKSLEK